MSLTFKQFSEYVEAPLSEDERVDELFGIFRNNEQKAAAERKKLELLAKRGNEVARMKLDKLDRDAEKTKAANRFKRKSDDEKFKDAKAKQDAENQEKINKAELARLRKDDPKAYAAAVFARRGKEGQYPSSMNTSHFYSKMRHLIKTESTDPDDHSVRDNPIDPAVEKLMNNWAIKSFSKWVTGPADLWHDDFPRKFADCASKLLKNADYNVLDSIGVVFADNCTSFGGYDMGCFVLYARSNPVPTDEDDAEEYAKKAIEEMFI